MKKTHEPITTPATPKRILTASQLQQVVGGSGGSLVYLNRNRQKELLTLG